MLLFRASRSRRPDPYLHYKIILFVLGASLAVAGIVSQRDWLINVGIGVLLIGVVLRVIAARRS